ncbi:MAG TPA: CPBP family intramembrane glutamic endopeptidase [Puia sp.]|nr:CPBP family intramembrane glutamic endopeptidase [Puia sp.]
MRSYLRIHSPWSQLAVLIMLLGAGFIFAGLTMQVILSSKGIVIKSLSDINYNDVKIVNAEKLIQAISSILLFLLTSIVFAFLTFRFKQFYFLGFKSSEKVNFYFLAVIVVLCSFPFAELLAKLNEHIPLSKSLTDTENDTAKMMKAFLKENNSFDFIINILLIALLPAICEEVFFRGCLQRILINIFKKPWTGIIVTAALFSAFHFQFAGFLPRMFLGIILGALFWYGNSLLPSIVGHFFFNAAQIVAVKYYPEIANKNPSFPIYVALISGCIVFGILYLLKKQSTVTYAKVYESGKLNEHNGFVV